MEQEDCEQFNFDGKNKNEVDYKACLERNRQATTLVALVATPSVIGGVALITLVLLLGFAKPDVKKEFQKVLFHNFWKWSLPQKSYAVAASQYPETRSFVTFITVIGSLCLDLTLGLLWLPFRYLAYLIRDYPRRTPSSFLTYRPRKVRQFGGLSAIVIFALSIIVPITVLEKYRQREFKWKTYLILENEKTKKNIKDYICKNINEAIQGETVDKEELVKFALKMKDMPVATHPQDWNPNTNNPEYNGFRKTKDWKSGSEKTTTKHLDQYRMFSPGVFDDLDESKENGDAKFEDDQKAEDAYTSTMYDRIKKAVDENVVKDLNFADLDPDNEDASLLALRNWCEADGDEESFAVAATAKFENVDDDGSITVIVDFVWPDAAPDLNTNDLKAVLQDEPLLVTVSDTSDMQMLIPLTLQSVSKSTAKFTGEASRARNADALSIRKQTFQGEYDKKTLRFEVQPSEDDSNQEFTGQGKPQLTSVFFGRTDGNVIILKLVFSEAVSYTQTPSVRITSSTNNTYYSRDPTLRTNVLEFKFSDSKGELLKKSTSNFVRGLSVTEGGLDLKDLASATTQQKVESPTAAKYPLTSSYAP